MKKAITFFCLTVFVCVLFCACAPGGTADTSASAAQDKADAATSPAQSAEPSEPAQAGEQTEPADVTTQSPGNTTQPVPGDTETAEAQEEASIELLSGYPEDLLPLYQCEKLELCSFTVRDDPNYIIGKDIYSVTYLSSASAEEIAKYYKSLVKEEDPLDENTINFGVLGSQKVNMSMIEGSDGRMEVFLTIGQKEKDYVDDNPFFETYPKELVDIPKKIKLKETAYEEQVYDNQEGVYDKKRIRYLRSFATTIKEKDFVDFYTERYEDQENFTEETDEYSHKFNWVSKGYECQVSLSLYEGDSQFLSVQVMKYM